jgi:hypothetical protein
MNALSQDQYNALRETMRTAIPEDIGKPDLGKSLDIANRGYAGGLLGAPADIGNELMHSMSFGYIPKQEKPIGGYEWFGEQMEKLGMVSDKRYPLEEMLAQFVDPFSMPAFFGTFAGRSARLADTRKLKEAQDLLGMGADAASIKKQTGWVVDPIDGKWKWDIPDNNAQFAPPQDKFFDVKASDIYDHPELYDNYGFLGDMRVRSEDLPGGNLGSYNKADNSITLNTNNTPEQNRATLVHEFNHPIQEREGFSLGGNLNSIPNNVLPENINGIGFEGVPLDPNFISSMRDQEAKDYYLRLGGEANARLDSSMMDMTKEERLNTYQYDPEYFKKATGVGLDRVIHSDVVPDFAASVETPDAMGKFLRGGVAKGQDVYEHAIKSHESMPIPILEKDGVDDFYGAVAHAQNMEWLDPVVIKNKEKELRWGRNEDGFIGNKKMAFPNESYPEGRNTYDSFGCGRGEYCSTNRLELEPCYGGDCYAHSIGQGKGRGVTDGITNLGLKKNSPMYNSVKDFWEASGRDIEATRQAFQDFRINYHKGTGSKAENFSVTLPTAPKGAEVYTNLQKAKGQDIRIGVDTDGSAWLSSTDSLDALESAGARTVTFYASGYYKPPPPHKLADRSIINMTISGWHPLPETLKRLEWAQQARDNGWNVILREVVADPKTFPDDAPMYNRVHELVDKSDFYYMAQPLHRGAGKNVTYGKAIGPDAEIIPKCCVGSPKNPHSCASCKTAEGLGTGFKEYWEKRGGKQFDDAPILPAIPNFREQQKSFNANALRVAPGE